MARESGGRMILGIAARLSLSVLLHRLSRIATPATPQRKPAERATIGPFHEKPPAPWAAPTQIRRRSAADRRAGSATAVLRWSFELSPPRAGEVAPVRDSSGGPQDVPGGDRTGWERFAPLCRGRVRAIPAVRHSRQRIRSRALRRLRRRAALKDRADANIRVEDASSSDQVKIAALGLNFARAGASCSNAANPGRLACR